MLPVLCLRCRYTGDFSYVEEHHLNGAEADVIPVPIDICICESTYGKEVHEDLVKKEKDFLSINLNHEIIE